MSNHARNRMVVSGKIAQLKEFWKIVEGSKFTNSDDEVNYKIIESILPMPKELDDTTSPPRRTADIAVIQQRAILEKKYGANNWYDWQCKNWGVKWGDYETKIERMSWFLEEGDYSEDFEDGFIRFRFDTAWGMPEQAILSMSEKFPKLQFHCITIESGMEWKAQLIANDGKGELEKLEYIPYWDDDYA